MPSRRRKRVLFRATDELDNRCSRDRRQDAHLALSQDLAASKSEPERAQVEVELEAEAKAGEEVEAKVGV